MTEHKASRWIFALAIIIGLYQMLFVGGFGFGPGWEAVAIARELVKSGSFANPFQAGPSGPTAVIPPLYPFFLARLMKLLGDTPAFAVTVSLLAVFVQALHASLMPRVSLKLLGDPRAGVWAGVFATAAYRLMPQWDAMYTCCGILLFLLYASMAVPRSSAFSGIAAGLLLLTNPSTLLITVPWLGYLWWKNKSGLFPAAVAVIAILFTVLPWMARNQQTLGSFALKSNLGFTLYVSNSDCAPASLSQGPASACMSAKNPNKSADELALLSRLGEARYDALRKADAMQWIRSHRDAFIRLTLARVADFWFPPEDRTLIVWVVTALSLPGFYLWLRRRLPVSLYLVGVTLLYPVLYYLVVIDIRYRYPVLWISLLGAGYAISELLAAISAPGARKNTTYPAPPSPQTAARPART